MLFRSVHQKQKLQLKNQQLVDPWDVQRARAKLHDNYVNQTKISGVVLYHNHRLELVKKQRNYG